jgi:tetratricopeptide (TPR) repeat protein
VRLLVGFVAVYAASVIAFFIFSRYRIQVLPALLPLAGLGAVEVVSLVRRRLWRRLAVAALLWAGATWFCSHTVHIFAVDNQLIADLRQRHLAEVYLVAADHDRALEMLREGVERCPRVCSDTFAMLMDTYRRADRHAEAEAFLRRFTEAHPDHGEAWLQLAGLLRAGGREDEARECERRGALPPR